MKRSCLSLRFAFLAGAQQSAPAHDQFALLEGQVIRVSTGVPLRKAHVTLESSAAGHDVELVATTDDTGHFRFAEVNPGVYRLTAEKAGFLEGGYGMEGSEDAVTLLKVQAGDRVEDIALRLFPAGAISGHILDTDGDPASGYEVVLLARHRRGRNVPYTASDQTTTNHAGEYRFDGLTPDSYRISAGRQLSGVAVREIPVNSEGRVTNLRELWTFYPDALSLADAQTVRVESGQEQSSIDIHIVRGSLLKVEGKVAAGADFISKYRVSARVEEGLGWTSEAAELRPSGEFAVELLPGKHDLALIEQTPNGPKEVGNTEIDLADQDVSGVVITRFKPAQVSVRVVIEGEETKPLSSGSVFLNSHDESGNFRSNYSAYAPQNGVCVMDSVPAGKYKPGFNNATGCYLKSVQSDGRELDTESIDVHEGATLNLVLTFSRSGASLTGEVEVEKDHSTRSARVLLISEKAISQQSDIHPSELDQTLHFSSEHLRPGKYMAFASQEGDFDLWGNPDFVRLLEADGVELELHENEHANVHLKLIPKTVTDRIRQQLGL